MSRWYPYLIYFFALGNLYFTTLPGLSVVGSDISRELLMSKLALFNGWDLSLLDPGNTSFVVGFMVPSLSLLLSIETEWVYKVIIPIISAFTPVLMYLIFRKQFGDSKALFASIFFIIMPVYSLEIGTIAKSMVAETFMAFTLWYMFTNKENWNKCAVMILGSVLTLWSHYTVGIILLAFLTCIFIVRLVIPMFKGWKLWNRNVIAIWAIPVVIVVSVIPACFYYANVSKGLIANTILATAGGNIFKVHTEQEFMRLTETNALKTTDTDSLLKAGIGKDFSDATELGKVFRVVQYLTQVLIILGAIWLLFKHRMYKFSAEFIACISGSFVLLLCCIFIPSFASIINMTRWYHATLFFLSPMFILGFDWISYKLPHRGIDNG
jgi:uncharacterized membrane protein